MINEQSGDHPFNSDVFDPGEPYTSSIRAMLLLGKTLEDLELNLPDDEHREPFLQAIRWTKLHLSLFNRDFRLPPYNG